MMKTKVLKKRGPGRPRGSKNKKCIPVYANTPSCTQYKVPGVSIQSGAYPEKALRDNSKKLKWGLVHFKSLEPLVKVLEFGAKKYAPDNWKKPMDKKEILECAQRHLAALMDGEELDSETGILHSAHVMCNMMFHVFHSDK